MKTKNIIILSPPGAYGSFVTWMIERCNAGVRDHKSELVNLVPYYPWTTELHYQHAKEFGFKVDFVADDLYGRLYAEWSR